MIIEVDGENEAMNAGYIISVAEEIRRVLITRKGSIPMNPYYGSDLWKYWDRTLDGETRLGIISETFDAIERNVTRVRPTRAIVEREADGKFRLRVEVEARHAA